MKKTSKIFMLVFFVLVVKYVLCETLVLFRHKGNVVSLTHSTSIIHSSNNCEVRKNEIKNNKFINGNVYLITIYKNKMNYGVTKNPYKNSFYINSNFFGKNGKPIGEVIIDGKRINKNKTGGGYFTSNGADFNISFYSRPKNVKFSSQTHLIGIKNGKINQSIMNQQWSKENFYRILVGKDRNGNMLILHSDRNSLISIKMICEIALKNGMVDGLLFDGGSSVDVGLEDGDFSHSFGAVPNVVKGMVGIKHPPVYISGNFKN